MKEIRVLSPTAILGYGFPLESFMEGMKKNPDVIAVDAGSTDPGPYYLGAGKSFTDRKAVKRDLDIMITNALEKNIPVLVGTGGGSGAKPHLDWTVDIIKEISKEKELEFKLGIIPADIDKNLVKTSLIEGKVLPLEPAPTLSEDEVDLSTYIVGQMGVEPFIKALDMGCQVIVSGRAYDPVVFAALGIKEGFDPGLALHMGKILECAAIASTPGSGSDCMFGILGEDYFELMPLSNKRKCTTLSVAAHTLYEKSNPYILPGPGGIIDLTNTTFEQKTENSVVVRGSKFVPSEKYTIKLEGAKKVGYRTVSICATIDPIMISQIDDIIIEVKERVANNFEDLKDYFLDFKIYGKNGVMGIFEGFSHKEPIELGIVIESIADSEDVSATICSFARSTLLHFGYNNRKSTAGNLAFPFSPSDFKAGEVYNFNMYHIIETKDGLELFNIEMYDCMKGELK
ncbi:MAG: acyclic terpene utilization AtuA family protein [Lachnospirales bacterium]